MDNSIERVKFCARFSLKVGLSDWIGSFQLGMQLKERVITLSVHVFPNTLYKVKLWSGVEGVQGGSQGFKGANGANKLSRRLSKRLGERLSKRLSERLILEVVQP